MCNDRFRSCTRVLPISWSLGSRSNRSFGPWPSGASSRYGRRDDDWIQERLEQHPNPRERSCTVRHDGRWIQINERKTRDGGTVGIYTDVTELKRAEEAVREKTAYLEISQVVTSAANQAKSVENALQIALDESAGTPDGRSGTPICLPTGSWLRRGLGTSTARTVRDVSEGDRGHPLRSGNGPARSGAGKRETAWILDVTKDPNFPRAKMATDLGVKGAFAFPVLVGSDVVAVLEFYSDQAVEPDEALLDVMAQIGIQLGRVVERKRSEKQLEGPRTTPKRRPRPRAVPGEHEPRAADAAQRHHRLQRDAPGGGRRPRRRRRSCPISRRSTAPASTCSA